MGDIIQTIAELASLHIRVTTHKYTETDDLLVKVKEEFGDKWDILDWNVLKNEMDYEELHELLSFLKIDVGKGCLIQRDGKRFEGNGRRHHFFERHNQTDKEGKYPSNWYIPDHIRNHMLDLGSWYGLTLPIIATRVD